eukprot:GHVR01100535.1.p2 GENE.GHVR01100535.1~~GHVR01100535.1.p2  ORF type:complete len:133 (+),score=24.70 GHVR01100535.1:39-437(+)
MVGEVELKDLIGKHVLTGIDFGKVDIGSHRDANTVDLLLDDKKISIIEDPEDGYRSSMNEVMMNRKGFIVKNKFKPIELVGFFREPISDHDIVDFIDSMSGRVVLSIGTENYYDYYPVFINTWTPENLHVNI